MHSGAEEQLIKIPLIHLILAIEPNPHHLTYMFVYVCLYTWVCVHVCKCVIVCVSVFPSKTLSCFLCVKTLLSES